MDIPEVSNLFKADKVEALSDNKIKIGCAEFTRSEIYRFINCVVPSSAEDVGACYYYEGREPWWVRKEDCNRALAIMDAYGKPDKVPDAIPLQDHCRKVADPSRSKFAGEHRKAEEDWAKASWSFFARCFANLDDELRRFEQRLSRLEDKGKGTNSQ